MGWGSMVLFKLGLAKLGVSIGFLPQTNWLTRFFIDRAKDRFRMTPELK